MKDRETLIKAIEQCVNHVPNSCIICPYNTERPYNLCIEALLNDVLDFIENNTYSWTSIYDGQPKYEGDYLVTDGHEIPWKCRFMKIEGIGGWANSASKPAVKFWTQFPLLPSTLCSCYYNGECWGTKEREKCNCKGYKSNCDKGVF